MMDRGVAKQAQTHREGVRGMAKKKQRVEERDNSEANFMMLFTSLMIIVLAFFILLNSMAVVDEEKRREAIGSLHQSFTSPYDGFLVGALESLRAIRSQSTNDQIVIDDLIKDIEELVESEGLGVPGEVEIEQSGLFPRLTIASGVLYPKGGIEVSPHAFPILDKIALAAKGLDCTISIESRTDSRPPESGRIPSNWERSATRAMQIQRYMMEAAEIPAHRIEAEGVAHLRADGKAENQVVITLRLHNKESGPPSESEESK